MDVSIVVSTFGEEQWRMLADRRAMRSAATFAVPVHQVHGASLHEARNEGLDKVSTEFVCFLDGDDELEPGYFDRASEAARPGLNPVDLVVPAVRYVRHHWTGGPATIPRVVGHDHDCEGPCLVDGNFLVIGSIARTEIVRSAGGFRDWPMYEDWDLWLRCHLHGATVVRSPRSVYKAWVRNGSRNRGHNQELCAQVHSDILESVGLPGLPGYTKAEP